jgi:hypothetical protein
MRAEQLIAALAALTDDQLAYRTGRGVRGHPYRWRRRRDDDVDARDGEQLPLGAEAEEPEAKEEKRDE